MINIFLTVALVAYESPKFSYSLKVSVNSAILFVKRASLCLAGGFGISLNLSSLTGRDPHKLAVALREGGRDG